MKFTDMQYFNLREIKEENLRFSVEVREGMTEDKYSRELLMRSWQWRKLRKIMTAKKADGKSTENAKELEKDEEKSKASVKH